MTKTIALICLSISFAFSSTLLRAQKIEFKLENKPALPQEKGSLMAGAAMLDITPPPGLATTARSLTSPMEKGFRTRLKVRTFYIRDKDGTSIALVQLDLAFGSLLMHHDLAQEISQETDVPIGNLILSCTHTHSGPGNFFSNDFFNKHAGRKKWLDPDMYNFLKGKIKESIVQAYKNIKPAKIATGMIEVYGYSRNRAIKSFIRNKGNEGLDPNKDSTLIFKSINPRFHMIRIDVKDGGSYRPLGAFSTFSIHGTAIGEKTDVVNADVFAYVERDLAWQTKKKYGTSWLPISAIANGTEGDIAPNIPFYSGSQYTREVTHAPVDWKTNRRLGMGIATEAWKLFQQLDNQLQEDVKIQVATKEIDIAENNVIDGIEICKIPSVGTATLSGAYENRSPVDWFPVFNDANFFTRRWFYSKNRCQGNKVIPFGPLFRFTDPAKSYPKDIMFQLVQIGDMLLVPLPWEITTTTGKRIEEGLKKAYEETGKPKPKYIAITSLANDYVGYATTPEEFSNQNYEAGQTIYGKNTQPYISAQLYHLQKKVLAQDINYYSFPESWHYKLKYKKRFPLDDHKVVEERTALNKPQFLDPGIKDTLKEPYYYFEWKDNTPGSIKMDKPFVNVQVLKDGQWQNLYLGLHKIDDEGYDVEVRMEKAGDDFAIYQARWYNPVKGTFRFEVFPRTEAQKIIYSDPFTF